MEYVTKFLGRDEYTMKILTNKKLQKIINELKEYIGVCVGLSESKAISEAVYRVEKEIESPINKRLIEINEELDQLRERIEKTERFKKSMDYQCERAENEAIWHVEKEYIGPILKELNKLKARIEELERNNE